MPTKVTPLPKTGGGGGGGKAPSKPTTTTTSTKSANSKKPRFLNTKSKLSSAATKGLSHVEASRGKGYLQAIVFTACVGLGLLILGSVLVHIGDENYIVDIMVLGALFIIMGLGSLVVGCLYTIRPIYKQRKLYKEEKANAPRVRNALPSVTPEYMTPAFRLQDLYQVRPPPGTSASSPVEDELYDRKSLNATEAPGGRLIPPPPPQLAEALREKEGTSSTVLTTVVTESDEVSELGEEASATSAR